MKVIQTTVKIKQNNTLPLSFIFLYRTTLPQNVMGKNIRQKSFGVTQS